jgi:hypothetical protein
VDEFTQQMTKEIEMRVFVGAIAVVVALLLMAPTAGAVVTAPSDTVRSTLALLESRSKTAVVEQTTCNNNKSQPRCGRLQANSHHQRPHGSPLAASPAHVLPHHLPNYYVLHGPWL